MQAVPNQSLHALHLHPTLTCRPGTPPAHPSATAPPTCCPRPGNTRPRRGATRRVEKRGGFRHASAHTWAHPRPRLAPCGPRATTAREGTSAGTAESRSAPPTQRRVRYRCTPASYAASRWGRGGTQPEGDSNRGGPQPRDNAGADVGAPAGQKHTRSTARRRRASQPPALDWGGTHVRPSHPCIRDEEDARPPGRRRGARREGEASAMRDNSSMPLHSRRRG